MPQETLYTQYPDTSIDSRGRYFDGQFLGSQDFTDEQRYHVDRLRRLAGNLRVAGVITGLEVSPTAPLTVSVAVGTGIDGSGRQLVLSAPRTFQVPQETPRPAAYVLALRYGERVDRTQGGRDDEPGTRGDTRFLEEPALALHPQENPLPATDIGLARLALAADGTVTVTSPAEVRRYSGLRLPGPGGAGPRLLTAGDPDPSRAVLAGALSVTRDLVVTGYANVGALHVRSRSFKLGGAGDKFYPVVFSDAGWVDGALVLEISRANTHIDREWWGALVARLRIHGTNWGHGAEFDEVEVVQEKRRFIARYAAIFRAPEVVVWLRGDTTYQWRSNHAAELAYAEPAETTRGTENLPVLAAIDPALDRDRFVHLSSREEHVMRLSGAAGGWDRLTLTATNQWGDGPRYATLGAGYGSHGVMFHNPHVTWHPGESRASIRYGRTGGAPGNTFWDVGVRADKSFSVVAYEGGADGAERLKITHDNHLVVPANATLRAPGRLHITGDERLYILNKSGVTIGKEWGGTGTLSAQGSIDTDGDLSYSGRLNKLDTTEQSAATVRAADLALGHSTRRGTPGRALVDNKDSLVLNNAGDWPKVAIGSPTEVAGDLTYSGRLNKLDTTEQGGATIRAADLNFGHSGRRGNPGRALVDGKTELIINYGVDWPRTQIHGPLQVTGGTSVNTGTNPLHLTGAWQSAPDAATNIAEISNDTSAYKTLMIVGNRSAAADGLNWPSSGRRVSVWDRLEVNGHLLSSTLSVNTPAATRPLQQLHVSGRMFLEHGVIQRGGTQAITNTSDLGLYSQVEGNWLRYVSKNGSHMFFNDGGAGTNVDFTINAGNTSTRLNHSADSLTARGALRVEGLADFGPIHRRAASFKLAGDVNFFYPVIFDDIGWADGPCEIEISRADVHRDVDWHGSIEARFTFHGTAWGHGSDFDEVSIAQNRRLFVARYALGPQNRDFVVWLRGNTTYSWRSNHRVDLVSSQAAEVSRPGATYPILTAVDDHLNAYRYYLSAAAEAHTFRLAGATGGWDKIVLGTTKNWGDGESRYATIGAGGAHGIMLHNPHISWIPDQARASLRYGRVGSTANNTWWDAGVRNDKSFSFIASEGGADGAERLKITHDNKIIFANSSTLTCPGRLHISGDELLYILNKSGVIIGKDWGGNGNLNVQGTLTIGSWRIESDGNNLYFRQGGYTVARLSIEHDRLQVYRHCNGAAPYFYFNSYGQTGVYSG